MDKRNGSLLERISTAQTCISQVCRLDHVRSPRPSFNFFLFSHGNRDIYPINGDSQRFGEEFQPQSTRCSSLQMRTT